ncbi:MAG: ferrochelatase, partial [Gammaproteobacteria bacterium]|nr:ferrochelatase [Gammaproteobacteria bacterium]
MCTSAAGRARTSSDGMDGGAQAAGPGQATGGDALRIAVLLINFGEPAEPVLEEVTPFLERIFLQNADLESDRSARARAAQLAAARAPHLVEAYRAIGGS